MTVDGDAPEGEILGINSVERVRNLGLHEVFEVADRLNWLSLDRERVGGCLSINKTEKGQKIVGHDVAKHQLKAKVQRRREMQVEERNVKKTRKKERRRVKEKVGKKNVMTNARLKSLGVRHPLHFSSHHTPLSALVDDLFYILSLAATLLLLSFVLTSFSSLPFFPSLFCAARYSHHKVN